MSRKMPPKDMNYVRFDKPPAGLKTYKTRFGKDSTPYLFIDTEFNGKQWVSTYEWWFPKHGGWYCHVNQYIGQKKGENFKDGRYAEPLQAYWRDAEGKTAPYDHANQQPKPKKSKAKRVAKIEELKNKGYVKILDRATGEWRSL